MNTKKSARIFSVILLGLLVINLVGVVLAADPPVADPTGGAPVSGTNSQAAQVGQNAGAALGSFTYGIKTFIDSFLKTLFGDTLLGSETLSKVFFVILIAMVVYTALGSFFDSKVITWGATLAVTFLAIISIPDGFLESIRAGYGAAGATILSVIPFVIIFWFSVKTKSLTIARITWIFFSIYYLFLFLSMGLLTTESTWGWGFGLWATNQAGEKVLNPGWFYFLSFFVGIISFIFIPHIRNFIFKESVAGVGEEIDKGIKLEKVFRRAAQMSDQSKADALRETAINTHI